MTTVKSPALPLAATPAETATGRTRIQSVDALRGAIMILMALDHTRDFLHAGAMSFSPTDLSRTTAAIFLTRWITHFCAPVFAFTAGIGAFFWARRRTKAELSRFLLTRGLWLMFLEWTVVRFIFNFEVRLEGRLIILTVFWMLGLCMAVMAALVHLPTRLLLALSVVVIAAHNFLDPVGAARFGAGAWLWNILHQQGLFRFAGANILVAYPLIPWFAVMTAGYCLGPVLLWPADRRRGLLLKLGLAMTVAFVLVRAVNLYGDPVRWSQQKSALFTLLSFLNCTKYPPSLEFLLMTLGPALLAMAWLEGVRLSTANPAIVFGRVPFFFFLVHLAFIHVLTVVLHLLRYGPAKFLLLPGPSLGGPRGMFPSGYGFNLGAVYAVWIAVVLLVYPACRWYAGVKQRRTDWWLSYL